jgi:Alpha/beta hydrolase domain
MAVIAWELTSRHALADGRAFGAVGPYEHLDGTAHFAVDPTHPFNKGITDLHLAPRDDNGLVHFAADVCILTPVDAQRGNHRLLFDVPNRGNRLALWMFNHAPRPAVPSAPLDPGNGFLMRQGYTIVWCGWQHDVPAVDGLMRIRVPEARSADGPISGKILVKFQPNAPSQVQLLSDRLHRPYPATNLSDPDATLFVRDADEAPPQVIPRAQWSFAKLEAGKVVPDASHIYLASGFVPGKLYQVVYTTTGAPVIGLGLLTARDLVAFLRYGTAQAGNPCAGGVQHAYAFGASQSGRYLRQFLYLGLNEDEQDRLVFDGLLVHIAGGKRGGDFNQRFGQPSSTLHPSMSDLFPFTDTTQTDPETGRTDGLLKRLSARQKLPKIFFTNSSTEYWRGDASLAHTDVQGTRDVPPSASVRIYHYAGTQHASGMLPLTDTSPIDGSRGQQLFNCVDYTPLLRAALVRLDRWVTAQEAPPPSRYPCLADGTAVPPEQTAVIFTAIPGVQFPAHLPGVVRLDFGPEAEAGIATPLPPSVGQAYPHFVPAVDADGNEQSGIRLPDISIPLATYTGWNGRHPEMGAPDHIMALMGATIPFPPTQSEREASGDPRLSIEERYPSKADYLERVTKAAQALVAEGHLLGDDVQTVLEQASHRYDLLSRHVPAAQAVGG